MSLDNLEFETKSKVERMSGHYDADWFTFEVGSYTQGVGPSVDFRYFNNVLNGHIFYQEDGDHRLSLRRRVSVNLKQRDISSKAVYSHIMDGQEFTLDELKALNSMLTQFIEMAEVGPLHLELEEEQA